MRYIKHWHPFDALLAITGLLGGLLMAPPLALASDTTGGELDHIPTRLVVPTESVLYPDPICLDCDIVITEGDGSNVVDGTCGILQLTYLDREMPTFLGDLVLTVFLLDTQEHRTVKLERAVLADGQTLEIVVQCGVDWDWEDVESVWVELLPAR